MDDRQLALLTLAEAVLQNPAVAQSVSSTPAALGTMAAEVALAALARLELEPDDE